MAATPLKIQIRDFLENYKQLSTTYFNNIEKTLYQKSNNLPTMICFLLGICIPFSKGGFMYEALENRKNTDSFKAVKFMPVSSTLAI